MMHAVHRDVARRICELFGINPDTVTRVSLEAQATTVSRVVFDRLLTEAEGGQVMNILRDHQQHELPKAPE
jgi:hypothetical protein